MIRIALSQNVLPKQEDLKTFEEIIQKIPDDSVAQLAQTIFCLHREYVQTHKLLYEKLLPEIRALIWKYRKNCEQYLKTPWHKRKLARCNFCRKVRKREKLKLMMETGQDYYPGGHLGPRRCILFWVCSGCHKKTKSVVVQTSPQGAEYGWWIYSRVRKIRNRYVFYAKGKALPLPSRLEIPDHELWVGNEHELAKQWKFIFPPEIYFRD